MRLPHPLLESQFFAFASLNELNKALDGQISAAELEEVARLAALGLPPIASIFVLSTLVGINPGLIWSFIYRPNRHYRYFAIPKGKKVRHIHAPRVALKVIQKWISVQIQKRYVPPEHVFGFVPERSHAHAASRHCGADWVMSMDIRDFFQTTSQSAVCEAFHRLGYEASAASLLSTITCLNGALAQGSPASPVLSNLCFSSIDEKLEHLAIAYGANLTRYADDITFSGKGSFPAELKLLVRDTIQQSIWKVAEEKTNIAIAPHRLKVHGLLVHGDRIRLTKGYRN